MVWRTELRVVLEEKSRGHLRDVLLRLFLGFEFCLHLQLLLLLILLSTEPSCIKQVLCLLGCFFYMRLSLAEIIFFATANFRVFFAFPMTKTLM